MAKSHDWNEMANSIHKSRPKDGWESFQCLELRMYRRLNMLYFISSCVHRCEAATVFKMSIQSDFSQSCNGLYGRLKKTSFIFG